MHVTVDRVIGCDFYDCPAPAVRGGIAVVQPNGGRPGHPAYYACGGHPGILRDALQAWPVAPAR